MVSFKIRHNRERRKDFPSSVTNKTSSINHGSGKTTYHAPQALKLLNASTESVKLCRALFSGSDLEILVKSQVSLSQGVVTFKNTSFLPIISTKDNYQPYVEMGKWVESGQSKVEYNLTKAKQNRLIRPSTAYVKR